MIFEDECDSFYVGGGGGGGGDLFEISKVFYGMFKYLLNK